MDPAIAKSTAKSYLLFLSQANLGNLDRDKVAQAEKIFVEDIMQHDAEQRERKERPLRGAAETVKVPASPKIDVPRAAPAPERVVEAVDADADADDEVEPEQRAVVDSAEEEEEEKVEEVVLAPSLSVDVALEDDDDVEEKAPASPIASVRSASEIDDDDDDVRSVLSSEAAPAPNMVFRRKPVAPNSPDSQYRPGGGSSRFRDMLARSSRPMQSVEEEAQDSDDDEDEMFALPLRRISPTSSAKPSPPPPRSPPPQQAAPQPSAAADDREAAAGARESTPPSGSRPKIDHHQELRIDELADQCKKIADRIVRANPDFVVKKMTADADVDDWTWHLDNLKHHEVRLKSKNDMRRLLHSGAYVLGTVTEMLRPMKFRGEGLRDYIEEHDDEYEPVLDRLHSNPKVSAFFDNIHPVGDLGSTFVSHFIDNSRRVTREEQENAASNPSSTGTSTGAPPPHPPSPRNEPSRTSERKRRHRTHPTSRSHRKKGTSRSRDGNKGDHRVDQLVDLMMAMQQQQQQQFHMMQLAIQHPTPASVQTPASPVTTVPTTTAPTLPSAMPAPVAVAVVPPPAQTVAAPSTAVKQLPPPPAPRILTEEEEEEMEIARKKAEYLARSESGKA